MSQSPSRPQWLQFRPSRAMLTGIAVAVCLVVVLLLRPLEAFVAPPTVNEVPLNQVNAPGPAGNPQAVIDATQEPTAFPTPTATVVITDFMETDVPTTTVGFTADPSITTTAGLTPTALVAPTLSAALVTATVVTTATDTLTATTDLTATAVLSESVDLWGDAAQTVESVPATQTAEPAVDGQASAEIVLPDQGEAVADDDWDDDWGDAGVWDEDPASTDAGGAGGAAPASGADAPDYLPETAGDAPVIGWLMVVLIGGVGIWWMGRRLGGTKRR